MMNTMTSHLAISIDIPATPHIPSKANMIASMKNIMAIVSKPAIYTYSSMLTILYSS